MITPPTASSPGKPVSASFFARLIAWVKSGQLIEGVGYRLHRTPNGTSLEIDLQKSKSQSSLPWSFSCTEGEDPDNPGETKRTGGWKNCILQLGYMKFLNSPDIKYINNYLVTHEEIAGCDLTDDGAYVVEVDLEKDKAEIKLVAEGTVPGVFPEENKIRLWIGTVEEGKQTKGIHHHPVIYKYV